MVLYVSFSAVSSSFFALFEDVSLLSWVDDYIVFYVFLLVYLSLSVVNLLFLTVFVGCVFSCLYPFCFCRGCFCFVLLCFYWSFSVFVFDLSDECCAMCITLFFPGHHFFPTPLCLDENFIFV